MPPPARCIRAPCSTGLGTSRIAARPRRSPRSAPSPAPFGHARAPFGPARARRNRSPYPRAGPVRRVRSRLAPAHDTHSQPRPAICGPCSRRSPPRHPAVRMGVRAQVGRHPRHRLRRRRPIRLISRNGNDVTRRYPELATFDHRAGRSPGGARRRDRRVRRVRAPELRAPAAAHARGERRHRPQARSRGPGHLRALRCPVARLAVDDGHALHRAPRAACETSRSTAPSWQTPPNEAGEGATMIDVSQRFGLEGVVAKRVDGAVRAGSAVSGLAQGEEPAAPGVRRRRLAARREGTHGQHRVAPRRLLRRGRLHYAGKVGSGLSGAVIAELERMFAADARPKPVRRGPGTQGRAVRRTEPGRRGAIHGVDERGQHPPPDLPRAAQRQGPVRRDSRAAARSVRRLQSISVSRTRRARRPPTPSCPRASARHPTGAPRR